MYISKSVNERKIGIMLSYINILVHTIIGFLYIPILLHYIGKSEYGLYQLIGSLIAYFSIMDFGLTNAIVRFYARYRVLGDSRRIKNLLAVSLLLYGAVAAVLLIAGGVCYLFLDTIFGYNMTMQELLAARQLFLLLLFNIVINLLTMLFQAVINAEERFIFLKGTELFQLVLQPVLVILVLQEYPHAFSVALVQTILNCILILGRIYYCFKHLHISIHFYGWDRELLYDFRKLALSIFAVSFIDQVFSRSNQIILGVIDGTNAVAVYSVAFLIYLNYSALSTAISGVYLPHVTELIAQKASVTELSALFNKIGRTQYFLLLLVLTGFIIFGQQFIQLWAGNDFGSAYWMTLLIIVPFTIELIQNVGLSILQGMNQYTFRAKVYLGMGIINLALAVPLGMHWGGIGCAFATGLCMFLGNGLIMNWYYSRVIGLDIENFWKQIGKITMIGLLCLTIGGLLNTWLPSASVPLFVGKMAIYMLIYVGCIWNLVMNSDEKMQVRKIFLKQKFGKRMV